MKVKEIVAFLDGVAPYSTTMDFDNVGLLIGDPEAEVSGILVSLDCFDEVIDRAEDLDANLIVTHHPVIFDPLKSITADSLQYKLISKNISVISLHTNLDIAENGVNHALAETIGLYDVKEITTADNYILKLGELDELNDPYDFAKHLKEVLGGNIKFVAGNRDIKKVIICSGSGGGYLYETIKHGADAFVTADVKHNIFIEAGNLGISVYDAGHFNTEDVVVAPLCRDIAGAFPEIDVSECHFSKIEHI